LDKHEFLFVIILIIIFYHENQRPFLLPIILINDQL